MQSIAMLKTILLAAIAAANDADIPPLEDEVCVSYLGPGKYPWHYVIDFRAVVFDRLLLTALHLLQDYTPRRSEPTM